MRPLMKIAFAGLRHIHIYVLAEMARKTPGVEIAGFWEENAQALEEARRFFHEPLYADYEALLSDPGVDVVAVGDYYGVRGQRVLQALKAGKHVLCDKPLCTSLEELEQIEALSREKGLKVGCMLDLRYDPALRLAQKIIQEGQLGRIHALSFTGQHPLQWGTRPVWYFEEGKHGGTFNDIAIHGLDAVQWITGLEYDQTLYARQWNAFAKEAPDFCDCAQFMGRMSNGAGLMADVSYAAPDKAAFRLPSYWRFAFWGEKGWLECRLNENAVTLALSQDEAPRILQAAHVKENCITDLIGDLSGASPLFNTSSVFHATRKALQLQRSADLNGKDGSNP